LLFSDEYRIITASFLAHEISNTILCIINDGIAVTVSNKFIAIVFQLLAIGKEFL